MREVTNLVPVDFNPFSEEMEIQKITPTNDSQKEIWLSSAFGGVDANLAFNRSISVEFEGDFQLDAFKRSLASLILRHEALRSTISGNGEVLFIYKDFPAALDPVDLTALTVSDRTSFINEFLEKELALPLSLVDGPLFKVYIHKLEERKYLFTTIKHHAICDGWSSGIMLEELSKLYNAEIAGTTAILPHAYQMSDYARDEAKFKLTAEYKATEDYWLNVYKDYAPVVNLPADFSRVSPRTYDGSRLDSPIDQKLLQQIKSLSAKSSSSLVTTLLSAFEVFLYNQTNQKELVVGLPSSGQVASGLTNVVGHCVNLLPMRSSIDPQLTFIQYIQNRKSDILDAYDHQRLTFGELIKKLYIPRDSARITLVPVIFNFDMKMDESVSFDGLRHRAWSNPRKYETFDLFLNATVTKDHMMLEWSYNTGLFKEETIQGFHRDFRRILQQIAENPEMLISELSSKRRLDPSRPAATTAAPADVRSFNELFAAAVKTHLKKPAASFNDKRLNYEQLFAKSNQLASFLSEKQISAGDIVAVSIDRSLELLTSLIAILKIGATYVPLDPGYPQERLEFMLEDSKAKCILISDKYKNRFEAISTEIVIDEIWEQLDSITDSEPELLLSSDDLAYILYTSGSTGKPKGVRISHGNLSNFLLSMESKPGICENDRLLAITTISFDIAGLELFLPLIAGAEVVIADTSATKDGRILADILKEQQITILQATPSTWQMLIDSGWQGTFPLKALTGGEPLSKHLSEQLLTRSTELWNMYGPTETTIWSTLKKIEPAEEIITIGLPIANTDIYLVDEQGMLVAEGMAGEICIGGDGVGKGYLNRPELTNEKFINDPYSEASGKTLYRTGDLGLQLKNGEFQCLGRIDQQVKIRGHRVELGEIESILVTAEGIKQVVVTYQDDPGFKKALIAYVIVDEKINTSDDNKNRETKDQVSIPKDVATAWKRYCSDLLPAIMVPEEFVGMERFPLTPNGKIDKKALPKFSLKTSATSSTQALPLTANEKIVAEIWSRTLGLKDLKSSDDFFELGGHSLLAMKVMVSIEKRTGKRLPLASLFDNSTIEKMALQLDDQGVNDQERKRWNCIVPIKPTGTKKPLFLVHGGGLNVLLFKSLAEHFDEEQPVYGIQAVGMNYQVEMPTTMTGFAGKYVEEILEVDPVGPYYIAGYSMGGLFAFEMTELLQSMGKEVKFTGIIDTSTKDGTELNGARGITKKLKRQFYKVPFFVKTLVNHPTDTMLHQVKFLKRSLRIIGMVDLDADKYGFSEYEKTIFKHYGKAYRKYNLKPSNIEVTLFRAEKRNFYLDDNQYLGWRSYALRGVVRYAIPGDHKTLIFPVHAKELARVIQTAMDAK
jgi:amino acid adenylation domain-containing protein